MQKLSEKQMIFILENNLIDVIKKKYMPQINNFAFGEEFMELPEFLKGRLPREYRDTLDGRARLLMTQIKVKYPFVDDSQSLDEFRAEYAETLPKYYLRQVDELLGYFDEYYDC